MAYVTQLRTQSEIEEETMESKSDSLIWRHAVTVGLSVGLGAVVLVALLLSVRLTAVAAPGATTWYVHPNGSDSDTGTLGLPFATIQHAVDVAVDGDTILVAAGTYTENLIINEALTLRGSYTVSGTVWLPPGTLMLPGTEATVVNGSGTIGQPVVLIEIGSGTVELDGFTITGGNGTDAGGVSTDGMVVLRNCVVRDNTAANVDWGGGGVVGYDGLLTIIDSFITGNYFSGDAAAGGVRAGGSALVMINTVVADNHGDPGIGLPGIHTNNDLTLVNVTVANNDGDIVFNPQPAATLMITNTIVYSHAAIHLTSCPSGSVCSVNYSDIESEWTGGTGNISQDPLFVDAADGDYHLQTGSPCIDAGTSAGAPAVDIENTARDAKPDMGAYEWTGFRIFLPLVVRNS
jgi:hypothetical protein